MSVAVCIGWKWNEWVRWKSAELNVPSNNTNENSSSLKMHRENETKSSKVDMMMNMMKTNRGEWTHKVSCSSPLFYILPVKFSFYCAFLLLLLSLCVYVLCCCRRKKNRTDSATRVHYSRFSHVSKWDREGAFRLSCSRCTDFGRRHITSHSDDDWGKLLSPTPTLTPPLSAQVINCFAIDTHGDDSDNKKPNVKMCKMQTWPPSPLLQLINSFSVIYAVPKKL